MKTLLTTLCILVAVSAFGQGTAIRSDTGRGTNTSFLNQTNLGQVWIGSGSYLTNTGINLHVIVNGVDLLSVDAPRVTVNTQLIVKADMRVDDPGIYIGNGAGLTNLIGATNFNSSVVYNFNGKTTFNSVSYNTNRWAGPTNTLILATNYQDFIATTDCNITNVGGQLAGQNTWATLTISNSTASDITVRSTAVGLRAQGLNTTTALVIGAGKEGVLSYLCRDFKSTNFVTTAQSN